MSDDGRTPILAYGRAVEMPHATPAVVGQVHFLLSSGYDIEAGDPLFVSEADGSEVEYLGLVQEIAGGDVMLIVAQSGLEAAKSGDFLLWVPALYWLAPYIEGAVEKPYESGVSHEETLDGRVHSTRDRDSASFVVFDWPTILTADWRGFRDFIRDASGPDDGLNDFAAAFYDREEEASKVYEVHLADAVSQFRGEGPGLASANLRLQILGEGYPS